jgi:hypothetical protein
MYLGKTIRLERPFDDGPGGLLAGGLAKGGFGGRA